MIKYFNRQNGTHEVENIAGGKVIGAIYNTSLGKGLLNLIIKRKILSTLYGKLCDTSISRLFIKKFVKNFDIDINQFEKGLTEYSSFNDFFYRKLKHNGRNICYEKTNLISPCDSKLLAIENIDEYSTFKVKGFEYKLEDLINNKELSNDYKNGCCLIFRLCPTDYHRFHFIDSGFCHKTHYIKGNYFSVNPIALSQIGKIFCENKREYSVFKSDNFDAVLYVEIGATFVGSIIQTYEENHPINRGDEKGFFKFGGSTVMLFFKKNIIKIDDDIIINSNNGIESSVRLGEKIGVRI